MVRALGLEPRTNAFKRAIYHLLCGATQFDEVQLKAA